MSIFARLRALFNRTNRQTPISDGPPPVTMRSVHQLPGGLVAVEHGVFSPADLPGSGISEAGGWTIEWAEGWAYCRLVVYIGDATAAASLDAALAAGGGSAVAR